MDEVEQALDDKEAACSEGGTGDSVTAWKESLQRLQQTIVDEFAFDIRIQFLIELVQLSIYSFMLFHTLTNNSLRL